MLQAYPSLGGAVNREVPNQWAVRIAQSTRKTVQFFWSRFAQTTLASGSTIPASKRRNEHYHSERYFLRRGRAQSRPHDAVPRSRRVAADFLTRIWPKGRQAHPPP